jgi:hypothetical protein
MNKKLEKPDKKKEKTYDIELTAGSVLCYPRVRPF